MTESTSTGSAESHEEKRIRINTLFLYFLGMGLSYVTGVLSLGMLFQDALSGPSRIGIFIFWTALFLALGLILGAVLSKK